MSEVTAPYKAGKDRDGKWRVFAGGPPEVSVPLAHECGTGAEADFLAAHMNHAYHCGLVAGDVRRLRRIKEALDLD